MLVPYKESSIIFGLSLTISKELLSIVPFKVFEIVSFTELDK